MKNITNRISDCTAKDNCKNNSRKMNSEDNSCSSPSDKIEETTPNELVITRNAFQVMMDSRHKVIGSNSPGKLMQVSENNEKSNKETLVVRKKLFNNWSEAKGGAKRRRYEEDKDEIIKTKLNKRSKRLKKMLQVENKSECFSDDSDDFVKKKKSRRRIRALSCSSDAGNLPVTMECDTGKRRLNFKGIFKKEKATTPPSSPSKLFKKNGNSQDTSSNFVTELNKAENDITDSGSKNNSKSKINNDCGNSKKLSKKNHKHKKQSKSGRTGNEMSKENFSARWKIKINLKDEDSDSSQHSSVTVNENESNSNEDEILVSSESDENNLVTNNCKTLKVAPVFIKATPKPKLDPVVLEARRQFLMSGAPPGLKKLEKQFSVIEKEVELFPSISHIRQKCTSSLWALPAVKLKLKENLPLVVSKSDLTLSDLTSKMNIHVQINLNNEKIDKIKRVLKIIKQNNPDYPVYRSFKLLQEKNQSMIKTNSNRKVKERNWNSKKQLAKTTEPDMLEYAMWTEKYRARSSEDIIGNSGAVKSLKKWLENWKNFSQEINCKKRQRNNSSSEFELTDFESRDSWRLPGNTLILKGPPGSGKSTAVYAICEELGLNIIEVNASSKRTGKKLMQELQEATQSHQVRKNKLSNFTASKSDEETNFQEIKRMCVLLVEDIDIVFDQDEGFICALNQLITTSKRPIIMTTTDYESVLLKKISTDHELISFFSIHSSSLSVWLQILCLIEGQLVKKDDIGILLDFNKGDVRKTLLELQFWVQSGGQLIQNDIPVKIEHKDESFEEIFQRDENIKLTKKKNESNTKSFEHKNCVKSFLVFQKDEYFTIPYYSNVDFLWWNISNLLNLPDLTHLRINKSKNENKSISQNEPISKLGFKAICNFYDSLCITDIIRTRNNYFENTHMITSNRSVIKDGLELTEKFIDFNDCKDFTHEITHFLLHKSIKRYSCIENTTVKLNVGVPDKLEKRWREEQHNYQTAFEEIISCSSSTDRRSIALDYLPTLRTMARLESDKIVNNTKRGNRFRSYFKDLGLRCNENLTKWACNVLHD